MTPVIIHLVAAQSETGKTTIIENLLPELKQWGLRVAALKGNLQHYELDTPGKDSRRFAEAGADIAGLTTPDGFFLFGQSGGDDGITAAAEALGSFDLILVEGNKKSKNPKIEVVRDSINAEPLLPENTIAIVTDCKDLNLELPVLELGNSKALAEFIINHFFDHKVLDNKGESGDALTHFDQSGRPRMVDVSEKEQTSREAYAKGEILMAPETLNRVIAGTMTKGDVLGVAQVAAVMAVKETGRLIPMAHPLGISGVEVNFQPDQDQNKIEIGVRVRLTGQTGVEMEALTGVSVAALTIYDMCKAIDKNMVIHNIRLVEKKGGRSGHYRRE
ncbi:MAG: cyclic pyranopterin monophosphate synthase MoaC [Bacillota bacterium]